MQSCVRQKRHHFWKCHNCLITTFWQHSLFDNVRMPKNSIIYFEIIEVLVYATAKPWPGCNSFFLSVLLLVLDTSLTGFLWQNDLVQQLEIQNLAGHVNGLWWWRGEERHNHNWFCSLEKTQPYTCQKRICIRCLWVYIGYGLTDFQPIQELTRSEEWPV